VRIISGKYKSRKLYPNKVFNARPTTDFAKESLFNILNNYFYFEKVKVLDLFSGTGSIGIEFASRGSTNVEMVESDQKNFKFIEDAIRTLGIKDAKLIRSDALKYLEFCKPGYDIIFADPPYTMEGIPEIIDVIFKRSLLNKEGWFILEHSGTLNFKNHPNFHEERKYGNVHFSIFISL
jgi:16S rRNA (guanine966-N2)-methyltransferase